MAFDTVERADPDREGTIAELEARLAALRAPAPPTAPIEPEAVPLPPRRRRKWLRWVLLAIALLFGYLAVTTPLGRALEPLPAPAMLLVSADGQPIARRGAMKLAPVEVADLPKHVPMAFVSIEDRRFYGHLGIDPKGIARAAWVNLRAGGVREGGSTITQQLAKTAFLTSDQNMTRKFREVLIAGWLEAWLTKDEILGRYMSSIYFGDGVYGIRAAARHYFGREPAALSISQAAMLAGIVKAPSRLAPTNDLRRARARAELVEAALVREGVITERQARLAKPAAILRRRAELPTGTYFADWAWPQARRVADADYGEVRVATTLDSKLQKIAVRAIGRARLGGAQAALVAMRPDGRVVAMVGGRSYKASRFNRATQAKRQPGSTFKLFTYLAAIRAGMRPDDMVRDDPITVGEWSPRNYDGRYRGTVSLADAFSRSSNVAAVRLQERVGREAVAKAARDLGIATPLTGEASLSLGTSDTTLLAMTAAYAAVADGRYPVRPRGVTDEGDAKGWFGLGGIADGLSRGRLRSGEAAAMRELLGDAIAKGTGRAARLSVPAFGKTGTTQDHRDAMFIGFAGEGEDALVVGVWVGHDDNRPMKGMTGGGVPARIWRDFMGPALGVRPAAAPRRPVPATPAPADIPEIPDEFVLPPEAADIERSAEEVGRAIERLGRDAPTIEDLETVAREGRRLAEEVGREAEQALEEPPPPEERQ
ncbi:MAG: Multimodular transpeptidase-transglycosylase [uncultured Sphingomonadaceae bacterium]|uniref:Multimodular transpeptidase-transglycosylase n=1 Tax=uncultured Sphingomonadaceae bacterium TaxID=169976 RepID=A0A6J4U7T9_9SPHN|nr:MAG: Multimodular transpeptidase-transglycosylase [uncultured Sphingomonadaceae bacterium]